MNLFSLNLTKEERNTLLKNFNEYDQRLLYDSFEKNIKAVDSILFYSQNKLNCSLSLNEKYSRIKLMSYGRNGWYCVKSFSLIN